MGMTNLLFSNYVLIFLSSILIAAVVVPIATGVSERINLVDVPGSLPHHIHKRVTPLSGGIILVVAFGIIATIFGVWNQPNVLIIFIAAMLVFTFGIWDDLKNLSVSKKFLGQLIAVTILVIGGVRVQFLESPQIAGSNPLVIYTVLDVVISYLWLVGITNAFNLIDSMDGIAIGLSITALGSYFIGSSLSGQTDLALLCVIFLGISSVLFIMNSIPAKIFLGDSGAQTLGFILAAISILYSPSGFNQVSSWFFPILVLGVPIFDTCLVIYARLRAREPIFSPGLDHIYHRLVKIGFSLRRSVILINTAGLILAATAFVAVNQKPLAANSFFAGCLIAGIIGIILLGSKSFINTLNRKLKDYITKK